MKEIAFLSSIILFLLLMSCEQNTERLSCEHSIDNSIIENEIIVLGHIYDWGIEGSRIDPRLAKKSFDNYEHVWLGGDLCAETTESNSILACLDEIFDLSNPNTLWAVGNHDIRNGNFHLIENRTLRPFYYRHDFDSLAVLVIHTMIEHQIMRDRCEWRIAQTNFIHKELDDLILSEDEKTIIILGHNTVWSNSEDSLLEYETIGNAETSWVKFNCDTDSYFRKEFYPKLLELESQGKQVICIAGDGGQYRKTFYHQGPSGIEYYVTGINNSVLNTGDANIINQFNTDPDSVLILDYSVPGDIVGRFIPISAIQ